MSANEKKAIILAIDIGKNSLQQDLDGKTYFEKSVLCASMILKRKILTESKDHLALILFGSSRTINHLSSQGCCYNNIEIVTGLGPATWDLYKSVHRLSPSNLALSDWISTFVLAADMLKNQTKNEIFSSLRIVMFSNLATDIALGNIDVIATCLKTENIHLTIIGKDCEVIISLNPALDVFLKKTEATAVNFELAMPKLSYYRQKEVTEKSWNAPLSFGEVFDIKVFGYKKIDVTTESSNWLFSKNYETQYSTAEMKNNFLKKANKKFQIHALEVWIDAYNYGDKIVPVFDPETGNTIFKVSSKRCLQVLGFAKTTNSQRSFLMEGASYIFIPHKQDVIAFNAIFHSMVEKEEVMLVRKVDLNINLSNIGALFPQKEDNEEFFVYVNIPYVESEPLFTLPSLDPIIQHIEDKNLKYSYSEVTDIFEDGNEFVMSEYEYDPNLQSLYNYIVRQLSPDGLDLMNTTKSIAKNDEGFKKTFSLPQEVSENCSEKDNDTIRFVRHRELDVSNQCVITVLNPIEDFKRLLKNGFDSAIVCKKMQYITLNFIERSKNLEDLIKPVSTLKALREYYIANDDVKSYNNFMHLVKDAVLITSKEDMWPKFIESGIELITKEEIETSDISQESAEEFKIISGGLGIEFIMDEINPPIEFV
ncbi:X-ray repair cross-complementing protein 5-like isoform X2 [Myzus persicae]|uniref:X-ray repair cross-complementing protein 5-like isoform X2 n=1 Tax=Myzus persicae TaxID=13164 RepID=UPI000B93949B|nr:X-ray repair cross-complementing protein 5-like isoform X2 [Myzus persicae]